jgi:hypothetical protein
VHPIPNVGNQRQKLELALQFINERTSPGSPFLLVYSRPFHGDPEGLLLKSLQETGNLKKQAEFAGIELYQGIKSAEFRVSNMAEKESRDK